jgi:hypothetical protein
MNLPSLENFMMRLFSVIGMTIGTENIPVFGDNDIAWRIETVAPATRHAGGSQCHQYLALRTELDDLMSPCSLWRPRGGNRIGHPHVSGRIDVNAMWPDEPSAAEAIRDIAAQVELDDRVQIRIQAFVTKALGRAGIASDDSPEMFAVGVHRDVADCAHLPSIR